MQWHSVAEVNESVLGLTVGFVCYCYSQDVIRTYIVALKSINRALFVNCH